MGRRCHCQDYTRTGIYHQAITGNKADFKGKAVMDVGAGSGILSLFAAQVGLGARAGLLRGDGADWCALHGLVMCAGVASACWDGTFRWQRPPVHGRLSFVKSPDLIRERKGACNREIGEGPSTAPSTLLKYTAFYPCHMQAGARKVYAVEASGIVAHAQRLANGNAPLGGKLRIVHAKAEEADIPEKVEAVGYQLYQGE